MQGKLTTVVLAICVGLAAADTLRLPVSDAALMEQGKPSQSTCTLWCQGQTPRLNSRPLSCSDYYTVGGWQAASAAAGRGTLQWLRGCSRLEVHRVTH